MTKAGKSPRVAIVAATFPPALGGGVAAAHSQLATLLQKAGAQVGRFSFLDSLPSGDGVVRTDSPEAWKRWSRKTVKAAFRLLDPSGRAYQSADIVECWPGARKLRDAIVAFDPDEIILPDHGCPGLALGALPKRARATLVSHHNPTRFVGRQGLNAHSRRDARFAVMLENLSLRHIDRVVTPCRYMADCFKETYRFSGPVEIIPNLIDVDVLDAVERHDPRPEMGLPTNARLIYVPSAGSRFKGAAILPELLAHLTQLVAEPFGVFLSGAVSLEQLARLPENLPVHAPGALSILDNLSRVKACDIALSPTLIENFSMAFLEAQLMGLPVVTFDVGGNAELVDDGATGSIVLLGDTAALSEAALGWLRPSGFAQKEAIARIARKRFNPDLWLHHWLD